MLKLMIVVLFLLKIKCERQNVSDSGSLIMKELYKLAPKTKSSLKCDVHPNKKALKHNLHNLNGQIRKDFSEENGKISSISPYFETLEKNENEGKKRDVQTSSRFLDYHSTKGASDGNDTVVNYILKRKKNIKHHHSHGLRKFRDIESVGKKGKTIQVRISIPIRATSKIANKNHDQALYHFPSELRQPNFVPPVSNKPWYDRKNLIEGRIGDGQDDMDNQVDELMDSAFKADSRIQCVPKITCGITNKHHIRGPTVLSDDDSRNDSVSLIYTLINLSTLKPKYKYVFTPSQMKKKIFNEDQCEHYSRPLSKRTKTPSYKTSTSPCTTHKTKKTKKKNHIKKTTLLSPDTGIEKRHTKLAKLTTLERLTSTKASKWAKIAKGPGKNLLSTPKTKFSDTIDSNLRHSVPDTSSPNRLSSSSVNTQKTTQCLSLYLSNINKSVVQDNIVTIFNHTQSSPQDQSRATSTNLLLATLASYVQSNKPNLSSLNQIKKDLTEENTARITNGKGREDMNNVTSFELVNESNKPGINVIIEQVDESNTSSNSFPTKLSTSLEIATSEEGKESTLQSRTTGPSSNVNYHERFNLSESTLLSTAKTLTAEPIQSVDYLSTPQIPINTKLVSHGTSMSAQSFSLPTLVSSDNLRKEENNNVNESNAPRATSVVPAKIDQSHNVTKSCISKAFKETSQTKYLDNYSISTPQVLTNNIYSQTSSTSTLTNDNPSKGNENKDKNKPSISEAPGAAEKFDQGGDFTTNNTSHTVSGSISAQINSQTSKDKCLVKFSPSTEVSTELTHSTETTKTTTDSTYVNTYMEKLIKHIQREEVTKSTNDFQIESATISHDKQPFTYSVPIHSVTSDEPQYILTLFNKPNETNYGVCGNIANQLIPLQDDLPREVPPGLNKPPVSETQINNPDSVSTMLCAIDENINGPDQYVISSPCNNIEENPIEKSRVSGENEVVPPVAAQVNQSLLLGYLKSETTKKYGTVCQGNIHIYFEAPESDKAGKYLNALSRIISNLTTTEANDNQNCGDE